MPTYVYKFVDTGETIEVQQAFTDDTLTEYVHPQSGATMAVKKVFQPVGVTFKGGGFYKTDSRGDGGTKRSKEPKESAESKESSATTAGSDSGGSASGESSPSSSSSSSSKADSSPSGTSTGAPKGTGD